MRGVEELCGLMWQRKWEIEVQGQDVVAVFKSLKACSRGLSL